MALDTPGSIMVWTYNRCSHHCWNVKV